MNIAIIGAGAVGFHLAQVLKAGGISVQQIISRNISLGTRLAQLVEAGFEQNPEKIDREITHVILTVPDQVIVSVARSLPSNDFAIIHTSGSTSLQELREVSDNCGVLYPIQSFSIEKNPDWNTIPICIEAANKDLLEELYQLAALIGSSVHTLNSEIRRKVHLAAVFACNFSNHMFRIAQDLVIQAGLDSLMSETVAKAIRIGASAAQTGPAKRGDQETIKKHLELLSFQEEEKDIYNLLSASILKKYKR